MSILKANRIENLTTTDGGINVNNSGKVGIGTDSPGQHLTIKRTGGQTQVSLISDTTESGAIYFGDTASTNRGVVLYDHGQDSLQFYTAGSERMRILSGGGITFNSDTAQANALDDYEQGTWTPQLLGGTSNPSLTYSAQSGGYEKIGNLIHLAFFLNVSAVTSQGSGYLELHGLPYNPVTSPLGASEVPALLLQSQPFADGKAANRFAFARTVGGSSRMFVGYRDLTDGNAIIPSGGAANISTGYFIGHITYRTD